MDTSNLPILQTQHQELIQQFYTSFSSGDAEGMAACYHPDIVFKDPAFGILRGQEVSAMWHMLLERSKGELEITLSAVEAGAHRGSAEWVASYVFQATGRKVVNRVSASFEFSNGLFILHTDHFHFWRWARQALGWKGWLLGWTPWLQNKVQQQTNRVLKKYLQKKNNI